MRFQMRLSAAMLFVIAMYIWSDSSTTGPSATKDSRYPDLHLMKTLSEEEKRIFLQKLEKAENTRKVIIVWEEQEHRKRNFTIAKFCGSCEITSNKSLMDDEHTAAIMFNFRNVKPGNMPPVSRRRPDQVYVWQSAESSISMKTYLKHKDFKFVNSWKFNLTQLMRRDSDIVHSYGSASRVKQYCRNILRDELQNNIENILKFKTKFSVAVISNCHYLPGARIRFQFIKDLETAGLDIEKFGSCYDDGIPPKKDHDNFRNVLIKYKFYLAFENSFHCKDYITEKFFKNALRSSSVPVVWGAEKSDYEAVAPPNSFIYVDDFPSIKELIEYLNYLDKNNTAYLEYFRWYDAKDEDMPGYGQSTNLCRLCRLLHGINVDDIFQPGYSRTHPERPLFTDTATKRYMKPLRKVLFSGENKDCFDTVDQFYESRKSLAAISRPFPSQSKGLKKMP